MKTKLIMGISLLSILSLFGCGNNNSVYPKDKDGSPTNLMPESKKTLEFNAATIADQVNKGLPDLMYYDYHFDSANAENETKVHYFFSRTKTTTEQMKSEDFDKTQPEEDCKMYKTSTAWYYEECRKRNISIEFHWRDNTGKEVFSHTCGS